MLRYAFSAGLAFVVAASLPVAAQQAVDRTAAASSLTNNQIIVRDLDTGEMRAPTAAEAATLRSKGVAALPPSTLRTEPRSHPSGARGARLTDEFMNYSVLVRQPDGRLLEYCFASREAAEAAINGTSASNNRSLPTE